MKQLSPKAEELRQAIQDGIELEGITADAIVQTIVEVLISEEMTLIENLHSLSILIELSKWTP